jgi:hypothetical protein
MPSANCRKKLVHRGFQWGIGKMVVPIVAFVRKSYFAEASKKVVAGSVPFLIYGSSFRKKKRSKK